MMWKKWIIPVLVVALIVLHWKTDTIRLMNFVMSVNKITVWPFLETRFTYLYLHLFAIIPVMALSFDKKVAYYKHWSALFPALVYVAMVFWVWDIWKTAIGVWGFNPKYYLLKWGNLPIEEWLFFITFPWASVFIYMCLNAYFPQNRFFSKWEYPLSIGFLLLFLGIGFGFWGHAYTSTTALAAAGVLLWHMIYGQIPFRAAFYRGYLVGLIPFVLVNGVLTGSLTSQPVVVYNPDEYIGLRFGTIPVDDFIYNFVMLFWVTMLFEWIRREKQVTIL